MNTKPVYNEYVTEEVDYQEDIALREWEYYSLYEEVDVVDDYIEEQK
jgi:hypothetical protein